MKLITRDTDYALRAICFISKQKGRTVSVSELARELKIPRPFLRKILQVLTKRQVLISHKGIGGGFILGKPVGELYLVDLMRIFQGRFHLNECLLKKLVCPNAPTCILKHKIDNIEKYVVRQLKTITVGSLLG